jgi:hypothetical protein
MKTFGRILIIVVAFALVMGLTYFAVSAGSNNSNAPAFDRPQFQGDGFNANGSRPEFRGEGDRGGSGGWIFGMVKNIGIVSVIVAMIILPKNFLQQKRQAATVRINE